MNNENRWIVGLDEVHRLRDILSLKIESRDSEFYPHRLLAILNNERLFELGIFESLQDVNKYIENVLN